MPCNAHLQISLQAVIIHREQRLSVNACSYKWLRVAVWKKRRQPQLELHSVPDEEVDCQGKLLRTSPTERFREPLQHVSAVPPRDAPGPRAAGSTPRVVAQQQCRATL